MEVVVPDCFGTIYPRYRVSREKCTDCPVICMCVQENDEVIAILRRPC